MTDKARKSKQDKRQRKIVGKLKLNDCPHRAYFVACDNNDPAAVVVSCRLQVEKTGFPVGFMATECKGCKQDVSDRRVIGITKKAARQALRTGHLRQGDMGCILPPTKAIGILLELGADPYDIANSLVDAVMDGLNADVAIQAVKDHHLEQALD